jgi:hypothetical protein
MARKSREHPGSGLALYTKSEAGMQIKKEEKPLKNYHLQHFSSHRDAKTAVDSSSLCDLCVSVHGYSESVFSHGDLCVLARGNKKDPGRPARGRSGSFYYFNEECLSVLKD